MNDPAVVGGDPDAVWLVVGLGNPGPKYAGNRHNVGAMALDAVAAELGARFSAHRSRAEVSEVRLPPVGGRPGPRAVLAKPSSYMNESGGPVKGLLDFYKVPLEHLVVVHDELDIPFGEVRLKQGGGHAGHNGLRSLIERFGTNEFARLRIGIGRPPAGFRGEVADFVLQTFSSDERIALPDILKRAVDSVLDVLARGLGPATNKLHASLPKAK